MKKLIVLLLFVFGLAANAQQNVGGFLQANTGISITSGDFASTDVNNPAAGFAKNGIQLSALFGHKIYKDFGAYASFSASANWIDAGMLQQGLNLAQPNYSWNVEGDFYSLFGFMFGPQISHNFKKVAIDARLGFGVLNFASPAFKYQGVSKTGGPDRSIEVKDSRSSAFAMGSGITIKYEVKYSWVLLVNADYYTANPVFENVEQIVSESGQADVTNYLNFEQSFRMYQVGLGLGYVF